MRLEKEKHSLAENSPLLNQPAELMSPPEYGAMSPLTLGSPASPLSPILHFESQSEEEESPRYLQPSPVHELSKSQRVPTRYSAPREVYELIEGKLVPTGRKVGPKSNRKAGKAKKK